VFLAQPFLKVVYITIMANFFEKVKDNANSVEEKFLGPDYKYYDYINSPDKMGMSADGSITAITNDIAGLIGYVQLLSSGGGRASQVDGPLGNKFFLETGAKCKDTASGESVTRSLYVNNVPDGSIPFITQGMGVSMDSFKGLIPGTMSNLAQINPMQIFGAFMSGTNPDCQSITMETIDVNNIKSLNTAYVTTNDIANMNAKWFPDGKKPEIKKQDDKKQDDKKTDDKNTKEGFTRRNIPSDYGTMPNDVFVKLYYSSLTLLLLYILVKLFQERK
jgi:hypothetical protein